MDGSVAVLRDVDMEEAYRLVSTLLPAHYEEIAKFRDVAAIAPDLAKYARLEENGALFIIIAQMGTAVAGYSVNVLASNMHYLNLKFAQNDLFYIAKPFRGAGLGGALIRATVDRARTLGAQLMVWHAKEGTPMDLMLPAMGYEVLDKLWAQRI